MGKTLIAKFNDELKKYNLKFVNTKEYNEKWVGDIIETEENKVVLKKHHLLKIIQWNKVSSFAKMTKEMVDMKNKLLKFGVEING